MPGSSLPQFFGLVVSPYGKLAKDFHIYTTRSSETAAYRILDITNINNSLSPCNDFQWAGGAQIEGCYVDRVLCYSIYSLHVEGHRKEPLVPSRTSRIMIGVFIPPWLTW